VFFVMLSSMSMTFFFYDLETSGLDPREDRIMQFAGIRTNEKFEPIGEPYNVLVKLNDDTLPSPEAALITGITPQSTQADGYTEAEFSKFLLDEIFTENTVVVGFNNIRFDDEFIRYTLWRNFYDPYEWSWKDGRSRWDMLDVVRMTRALRPEGISWPVDNKGNPVNRLELLTKENGIDHMKAHDALSDVEALIAVTKLIHTKQPQLFTYLLSMRDKKKVQQLVNLDTKQPFLYVSGRYDSAYQKATVAFPLTSAPNRNILVYDLRYDPTSLLELSQETLAKNLFASWADRQEKTFIPIPVKQLQYNHCPAIAPLGVLEANDGWGKIGLDLETIRANKEVLLSRPDFAERLRTAYESRAPFDEPKSAEAALYNGFITDPRDKLRCEQVRDSDQQALTDMRPLFSDVRLEQLLPRYKARNFPRSLTKDEQEAWENWRIERLRHQSPKFIESLQKLSLTATDDQKFILEELQLWAENILPSDE
jgi:exodeoxyribonuclease-1